MNTGYDRKFKIGDRVVLGLVESNETPIVGKVVDVGHTRKFNYGLGGKVGVHDHVNIYRVDCLDKTQLNFCWWNEDTLKKA